MRIIYILMTDWDWIKQRPQYIAEELSKRNDMIVFYPHNWWNRNKLSKNVVNDSLKLIKLPCLPKYRSSNIIGLITSVLQYIYFMVYKIRFKADFIWIEHPDQYFFSNGKGNSKVIYDCMDNYPELEQSSKRKRLVEKREIKLIRKTDKCFTSSEHLRKLLLVKYAKYKIDPYLVRNGFNAIINKERLEENEDRQIEKSRRFRIFYIGTISDWFDWEVIKSSLDDFDNIEYHIIGPISGKNIIIPKSERIIMYGAIAHDKLHMHISTCDLFCMLFKVNPLIEAVDPVKLYEYINFNRNIVCVNYKEVERFGNFAFLYNNYEEYKLILTKLLENNELKYTKEQRNQFLENNTWEERIKCIMKVLE
jgi:teichuronic acid biosynthesis glycosyltransferase TuaH